MKTTTRFHKLTAWVLTLAMLITLLPMGTLTASAVDATWLEELYVAGNGDGNWLNGYYWDNAAVANKMTEISDGIYEITFEEMEAYNDYHFKIAANGSWEYNWGAAEDNVVQSGVAFVGVYNSASDILFEVPENNSTVTIRADITGVSATSYRDPIEITVTVTPPLDDTNDPASYTAGDFVIAPTDGTTELTEDTDYNYADNKLTISTTTPVTISLNNVEKTDNVIIFDSTNGAANITLNNIKIETDNLGNSSENQPIYVTGENQVSLDFIGENTLSSNVEGEHQQVNGILVDSDTPIVLTSSDESSLSISNVDFGIFLKGNTAGGSITLNGSLNLDVSNCLNHAVYARDNGAIIISDTPDITIDTVGYALYAKEGITISGGEISVKNDDGYAICSDEGTAITISNDAVLHLTEAKRGVKVKNGKVTITDNAKYLVYNESTGEQAPAITDLAISSGELEISGNAYVNVFTFEDALSGGITAIKNNAQVFIRIDSTSTYSEYALAFDDTLNISDDATVDIDVINGVKIRGLYESSGTVTVSGNAVVTIDGTTYDGVYVGAINLSDNASVTVNAANDNAIYGDISVADNASLTATSVETRVIYDPCTVTPVEGKSYMVKYGASEAEATTAYYTTQTTIDDKSSWRYFKVEPATAVPVSISGTDKAITYDGNTYDVSVMFTVDENAGAATYSIVEEQGADKGNGTLSGSELTITKAGKIIIKIQTEATGSHLAGETTAVLTVGKAAAAQIIFPTASSVTYGAALESSALTGGSDNGSFEWVNENTIPTVTNDGYAVKFVPNDADLYDYTNVETEKTVNIVVNPLPISVEWNLPDILVYDGTDKTITAELSNKVGEDVVNLTTDGTTTAKNKGDYNASVTAVDNENYTVADGTNLTKEWSISAKELTADNVSAIEDVTYTGEEIKPVLEIKNGEEVLVLDTDYTVEYQNNINATTAEAKAKVVISFIGNFSGTAEKEFNILQKAISPAISLTAPVKNVAPQTEITGDGYTATVVWSPEVTDKFDYNTEYTATITITVDGNHIITGVSENGYTVEGAKSVVNAENSNILTVAYKKTGSRSSSGGSSSSNTTTTTTKNEDGSTTKTTENKTTGTKTEVTTNTDGSTTTVETKKDGTVTTTEKDKEGNTTTTVEKPDGTATITEKKKDGTTVKTETNADGETKSEIDVPSSKETEVTIPAPNAENVTSVVVTDKDGNETEITDFEITNDGVKISVSGDCTVLLSKAAKKIFDDVHSAGHWAAADIDYVFANGLMNGTSENGFSPDDKLTRAMLVTVLYRNEGEPATNRSIPFADIDMGAYYANAVSWAKQNGIVNGVTETEFAPDDNITREQIAAIMFRYAQYKGMETMTLEENLHFADTSEISEYAVSAMNWAVGTGLMKGKSSTTLNPKDNASRAEIAAILHRFIEANK